MHVPTRIVWYNKTQSVVFELCIFYKTYKSMSQTFNQPSCSYTVWEQDRRSTRQVCELIQLWHHHHLVLSYFVSITLCNKKCLYYPRSSSVHPVEGEDEKDEKDPAHFSPTSCPHTPDYELSPDLKQKQVQYPWTQMEPAPVF